MHAPDPDVLAAVAYCRVGGARPKAEDAFARAEALGLLSHHGIWHATREGEGLLIAVGLLDGRPAPKPHDVDVVWATEVGKPWSEQPLVAFGAGLREAMPEEYDDRRREAIGWFEGIVGGSFTYRDTTIEFLHPEEAPDARS